MDAWRFCGLAALAALAAGAAAPPLVVCDTKRSINDSLVDVAGLARLLPALVAALHCGGLRVPIMPSCATPLHYSAAHNATVAFARAQGLAIYASPMEGAWAAIGGSEAAYAAWVAAYALGFSPTHVSPFNEVGPLCDANCMHRVTTDVSAALPAPRPLLIGPDAEHVSASAALLRARADRLAVFDIVASHNAGGDTSNTRAQWKALTALSAARPMWSSENPACFTLPSCLTFGSMNSSLEGGAIALVPWNTLGDDLLLNGSVSAKGTDIAQHLFPQLQLPPTRSWETAPIFVKILVITMSLPEGLAFLAALGADNLTAVAVPGLSASFPDAFCAESLGVCIVTLGMGMANAGVSMTAILFSRLFNFSQAYFLIAGIAGIDPLRGTLGTAAWSRFVVDFGLQMELDARTLPTGWSGGYFGIDTSGPTQKPSPTYGTELVQLDEALLQRAVSLSNNLTLADCDAAQAYRAHYPAPPANAPPVVTICDSSTSNVWFGGQALGQRARDFTALLTDGRGVYCVAQQEDSATLAALQRGAATGLLNASRVAALRTASDFDRAWPGGDDADNLINYGAQGGLGIALENLVAVGMVLVRDVVSLWEAWRVGVPSD